MKIPDQLIAKLSEDPENELWGIVQANVNKFTKWFEDRPAIFFPEYTDHGIKHITAVCQSMTSLITEESWSIITPEDGAAIALSALLHDCAMHLKEEGFQALLESEYKAKQKIAVPQLHWKDLWHAYEREVARFSTKQCKELFNSEAPPPKLDIDNRGQWTDDQKLMIGEFLRRHHADIAYFFTLHGIPGPDGKRLQLTGFDSEFAELVGFIARSHNYPLRQSVDILTKNRKDNLQKHCNVHVPYVMGLLRIADYIQIGAGRAPKVVFDWRSLSSPRSQQEWLNHDAIKDYDIKTYPGDPETLWVHAEPDNVKTFLSLQTLLSNIQKELDATWASWGEAYGILPDFKPLGMTYRRIRSNIDDTEEFQAKSDINYVPVHAKFIASDGDLLKLLVGPLYGERPEYGVRELIQNAVDACLERDNYLKHNADCKPDFVLLDSDAETEVLVTLEEDEDGSATLCIEDRGIGMTAEIIQKYFLTVGVSFRSSAEWQEMHAGDGKSEVSRTGRFGIGLLAAFMLGDNIQVTTRHISSPEDKGIEFNCRLSDPVISMSWTNRMVGTKITIKIDEFIFSTLLSIDHYGDYEIGRLWDWYVGTKPKVERRLKLHSPERLKQLPELQYGIFKVLTPQFRMPLHEQTPPTKWRKVPIADFSDVVWSWEHPPLVCNGFLITEPTPFRLRWFPYMLWQSSSRNVNECPYGIPIKCPSLLLEDPDAKLPINLQRTQLTRTNIKSFNPNLCEAVCRDILAYFLLNVPGSLKGSWEYLSTNLHYFKESKDKRHPGFSGISGGALSGFNDFSHDWFIWNKEGFLLLEPGLLQLNNIENIFFLYKHKNNHEFIQIEDAILVNSNMYYTYQYSAQRIDNGELVEITAKPWSEVLLDLPITSAHQFQNIFDEYFSSFTGFSVNERGLLVNDNFIKKAAEILGADLPFKKIGEADTLFYWASNGVLGVQTEYLESLQKITTDGLVGFWKIDPTTVPPIPLSPLATLWKKIIGDRPIPFDLDTRHNELKFAYKELEPEITYWQRYDTERQ